jgi:hypothetical protein
MEPKEACRFGVDLLLFLIVFISRIGLDCLALGYWDEIIHLLYVTSSDVGRISCVDFPYRARFRSQPLTFSAFTACYRKL